MAGQGVGARVLRKEDDRLMRGRGRFVADIRLAGMQDVAFVRSPLAHARIAQVDIPPEHRDSVYTVEHLASVKPVRAVSGLPGFKISEQPVLAQGKVRHVGETVAMCVAGTRAEAEDIAHAVRLDLEELPPVHDMLLGRSTDAKLVHDEWADNVFLETNVDIDIERVRNAPIKVTREMRTSRQAMSPMEGRAVVAYWDTRLEQLVVYTSTQIPHIVRTGLAECVVLVQGQVQVVAPDVGGGFGYKGLL